MMMKMSDVDSHANGAKKVPNKMLKGASFMTQQKSKS